MPISRTCCFARPAALLARPAALLAWAALLAPHPSSLATDLGSTQVATIEITSQSIAALLSGRSSGARVADAAWHFLDIGHALPVKPSASPSEDNPDPDLRYGAARACGMPTLSALAIAAAPEAHRRPRQPDNPLYRCYHQVRYILAIYRRLFPLQQSTDHLRSVLERIARDGMAANWGRERQLEQAMIAAIESAFRSVTTQTITILAFHHANLIRPRRAWPPPELAPIANDHTLASAESACDDPVAIYVYVAGTGQPIRARARVRVCDEEGRWSYCLWRSPFQVISNRDNERLLPRLRYAIRDWAVGYAALANERERHPRPVRTVIDAARSSLVLLGENLEARVGTTGTITLLLSRAGVAMAILEGSIARDGTGNTYAILEHLVLNPTNVVPQPGVPVAVGASDHAVHFFMQNILRRGVHAMVMVALTGFEHRIARHHQLHRWPADHIDGC